ncbi:cell division protein FtsQ/DivIB [Gorillibacterium massiliense]|uniref:cell division protein FtsQ/DivIB n=1 Tax=Gorillibacterium massiliense TaxID=1280390 RepID=UPI0004B5531F|nr:FtsQ-type POTRA domain-containing protein [Gorillibacterium massiliense]
MAATIPPLKQGAKKRRGSRRLLYLLIVFFIIIFAVLFFQSSFSKITDIEISGNQYVEASQIGQAAAVDKGDSYFTVDAKKVENRLKALKTVEAVKVRKSFPGKLTITVKEFPKAAYRLLDDGSIALMFADGSSYPLKTDSTPVDRPLLTGWTDGDPMLKTLCVELARLQDALLSDISEIKPYPNVFTDRIKLYTRSRFEIITRISLLKDKIPNLTYYTNGFKEKNGTTGVLWLLEQDRGVPYTDREAAEEGNEPAQSSGGTTGTAANSGSGTAEGGGNP